MKSMRLASFALSALIVATLVIGFGMLYWNDHAWGAWGDDSAGYIFLAGRLYAHQPLVYYDPLVDAGYQFFGDEKLTRWLTPTHHFLINQQGVIASKYPLMLSVLMAVAGWLAHNSLAFYVVNPLLAVVNLALVYILAQLLFPKNSFRHAIGFCSSFFMGISELYYDHAIAQPMREIPSMTFFLSSMILCILAFTQKAHKRYMSFLFLFFSAILFGIAIAIRETTFVMLPAFIAYGILSLWHQKHTWKNCVKQWVPYVAVFSAGLVIGFLSLVWNSIQISKEKEVFKPRDTSKIVILSNIGHVDSFSIDNVFSSAGKFKPDSGSLPHFWQVIKTAVPVPYFWVLIAIGFYFLWKESKRNALLLGVSALGTLTIFSLWINPYSRYILPLFPSILLLGSYGIFALCTKIVPIVFPQRIIRGVILAGIVGTIMFAYQPAIVQAKENYIADIYRFKAISHTDVQNLMDIGQMIQQQKSKKTVLMFSGEWQYGTSETLEAHTGVKTIRFPLEQRFDFDQEQVYQFFDQMLADGYDMYMWIDTTASPEAFQFLQRYNANLVEKKDFTFQPEVAIYHIQRKQ